MTTPPTSAQGSLPNQRPFEFRGWHLPTRRLFVVRCFYGNKVWEEAGELRLVPEVYKREDCILLQYTGVVDQRGVKIFEGDVLHYCYEDAERPQESEEYYVKVVHWGGGFGVAPLCESWFKRLSDEQNDQQFGKGGDFDHVYDDPVVGNVFEADQLPPLNRFPTRPPVPPPDADPNPDAGLHEVNVGKKGLADAHKAMLRWEEVLAEIGQDVARFRNPYAYQVHFSWLGSLQGLDPDAKNGLFIRLRDLAKSNGVDWDKPSRKFYVDQRKEVEVV